MDKSLKFFLVFAIAAIILTIYLKITLVLFKNQFKADVNRNDKAATDLIEFAYDIHFNPPPDKIVVDNPYECTPTDLRPCKLDDPFSCIGCKSLISTCVHFEKDTTYVDFNGNESTIPANETSNDGYCLTQSNANQRCNPYHGDLVLVQTDPDSKESMLFCDCKNPGYIGNTDILGACDDVFICNGKIDDINQPLEDINCVCTDGMTPETINNVPTCTNPTVGDYKHYDDPLFYENVETVPKSRFVNDISGTGKFPGQKIRNPCKYCLFTGVHIPNGEMVMTDDEDGGWQCVMKDSKQRGLAIRRDPNHRLLKGAKGADAVIDVLLNAVLVHGYLKETTFEQMTGLFLIEHNKAISKYLNLNMDKKFAYIDLYKHDLVFPGSFGTMRMARFPGVYCTGPEVPGYIWDDFSFKCYFSNYIPSNRNPSGFDSYMETYGGGVFFERAPKCPPKHHSFITGNSFKQWWHYEDYNSAHYKKTVNGLMKYEITQAFKRSEAVKYIFTIHYLQQQESYHWGTSEADVFKKWFAITIPKDEDP